MKLKPCDPALRLLYERHYSFEAARGRIETILNHSGRNSIGPG
jgi:hypothetical protein